MAARDLTLMADQGRHEAADVLRKSATEGLDEFRELAKHKHSR